MTTRGIEEEFGQDVVLLLAGLGTLRENTDIVPVPDELLMSMIIRWVTNRFRKPLVGPKRRPEEYIQIIEQLDGRLPDMPVKYPLYDPVPEAATSA